jgi:hypothetical protein
MELGFRPIVRTLVAVALIAGIARIGGSSDASQLLSSSTLLVSLPVLAFAGVWATRRRRSLVASVVAMHGDVP